MRDMRPSAELRERVLATARAEGSLTRGETRVRNGALYASAAAAPLVVFHLFMGGVRKSDRPLQLIVETATAALLVAVVAGVVGLGRGASTLGRRSAWLLALVVATPVALLAAKAGISSMYADMMREYPTRPGFRCLGWSAAMMAWPLVALLCTRRGTDPRQPYLSGAATGTAVGAAIWVLVDLWCPVAYMPHLLLGHVLPLVLTTCVGTLLGGSLLAVRVAARK
jgi:hypothetical protein